MMQNQELLRKLAECAAACENCMTECLKEEDVKRMVACISTDRDCAKICLATYSFVAAGSPHAKHLARECAEICRLCANECEKHDHEHCQLCARACRSCAEACAAFIG